MQDQLRIADFFKGKYGIATTIVKDHNKFKIAIGRYEYQKLNAIIKPYIIPSMIYKICNPRNDLFPLEVGRMRQASPVA